jgi:hypothetical protein
MTDDRSTGNAIVYHILSRFLPLTGAIADIKIIWVSGMMPVPLFPLLIGTEDQRRETETPNYQFGNQIHSLLLYLLSK